jgi:hypothetical protein
VIRWRPIRKQQKWPADDPWWRFTPKNLAIGYLSLTAGAICLVWAVWSLLAGGLGVTQTVFFVAVAVAVAVIAVLWLVRTANGLKVLLRRRR